MCGGIGYNFDKLPESELRKIYPRDMVDKFKKIGMVKSFYWDKRPVLPVEYDKQVKLFEWGNRDKKIEFPKTGWAKMETIEKGKWNWLHPKKVKIPVNMGYEKGIWFEFKDGTEGIVVEKDGDKRVYMVTKRSDKEYMDKTSHDRMPTGIKMNFKKDNNLKK